MAISLDTLNGFVGKSISNICTNNYCTPAQSHCAHFVSHALGLKLGMLCGDMAFRTKHTGASIRVDELYNRLQNSGTWENRPAFSDGLLIFVLSAGNMLNGMMQHVQKKHVGIHFGGKVYNFSNGHHKVVVDHSVEAFHTKFKHSYGGDDISLYFGVAP